VRLLCDSVVVMREGRIVEDGSTARVMSEPAHSHTRAIVKALPQIRPEGAGPASGSPPAPGDAVA
jgi:ABC-type dipeptide/oligopeptide/nickel transport system ATPase component